MKIVDRNAFLEMPPGTLYAKYMPCVFSLPMIKGVTMPSHGEHGGLSDFLCVELTTCFDSGEKGDYIAALNKAERGESIGMDFDSWARDGLYELDQLFAIYEPDDIRGMIGKLGSLLPAKPADTLPPDPPPVDRTATTLADGRPVTDDHREIDPATGMQKDYVVLSAAERARGFVRPVRMSYRHVGVRPKHPLRDLDPDEIERFSNVRPPYVKYPESMRPHVGCYWTQERLSSGCGSVTTMSRGIAETYARDPDFYGSTMCVACKNHFPVGLRGEFVWVELDGSDGPRVGS